MPILTSRGRSGDLLALSAIVFDYGMVLTDGQNAASHAELMRITGMPLERFEPAYWADRHAYDEGKLTGLAFWQKLVLDNNLSQKLGQPEIEQLNRVDSKMWTTQNPAMLAWQLQLKQHGLLTGILSNMGDNVKENIEREFPWIHRFDALVWSYQLGIAKPDPAIYLYILQKLGVAAEETLFLDDKQVNIDAALALGMKAILFTTVEQLRSDLIAAGLDRELPLP
jgi:putative hydrolase of the HAD superfamily